MHWTDITHPKGPKLISCKPLERDDNVFYFQVQGVFDKLNPIARYAYDGDEGAAVEGIQYHLTFL